MAHKHGLEPMECVYANDMTSFFAKDRTTYCLEIYMPFKKDCIAGMIRVRVLTRIRIRYQPVYPYPLSAAVSLPLSSSFLGNAEVLDEVNHKGGYGHCYKRIYDTSCGNIRQGQYQYGYVRQQVCPGYAAARNLEMTRARASSPAQEAPWRTTRPHPVPMKHPPARAARRG